MSKAMICMKEYKNRSKFVLVTIVHTVSPPLERPPILSGQILRYTEIVKPIRRGHPSDKTTF